MEYEKGMPVLLVTVPHTGTKFFNSILKPKLKKNYAYMHVGPRAEKNIIENKPFLLTTVRNSDDVERSWTKRASSLELLRENIAQWLDLFLKYDPFVLSVDDRKEERLAALSEILGVELKTNWKPVGTFQRWDQVRNRRKYRKQAQCT